VSELEVRVAGAEDMPAVYALRHEVFVLGQRVPPEIERDDLDAAATHAVATEDGRVVGTGRLVARPDRVGVVGRMAVHPSAQGRGAGRQVLSLLEFCARFQELSAVELHAQTHAQWFYARAGYAPVGGTYLEAGIEHVTMRKPLPLVRPVRDEDSAALIDLIERCWSEYPGCVMDVDGEEPWLRAPASSYDGWRGQMSVVELDGQVVACVGVKPVGQDSDGGGLVELKSLYVDAAARRRGLGSELVGLVEAAAAATGAHGVRLWSDTRFEAAHRLYERLGYVRLPGTRDLHDLSGSSEFCYVKKL